MTTTAFYSGSLEYLDQLQAAHPEWVIEDAQPPFRKQEVPELSVKYAGQPFLACEAAQVSVLQLINA